MKGEKLYLWIQAIIKKNYTGSLTVGKTAREGTTEGSIETIGINKVVKRLLESSDVKKVTLIYVLCDPGDNWIRSDLGLFLISYRTEIQQKLKDKGSKIIVEIGNYDVTRTRAAGDGFFINVE